MLDSHALNKVDAQATTWLLASKATDGTALSIICIFHISDQPRAAHFFRSRIKRQYNGEGDKILRRSGGRPNCGRQRTEEGVQVNHQPSLEVKNRYESLVEKELKFSLFTSL